MGAGATSFFPSLTSFLLTLPEFVLSGVPIEDPAAIVVMPIFPLPHALLLLLLLLLPLPDVDAELPELTICPVDQAILPVAVGVQISVSEAVDNGGRVDKIFSVDSFFSGTA